MVIRVVEEILGSCQHRLVIGLVSMDSFLTGKGIFYQVD